MDGFTIHYFTRRVGHDTDDLYAYFPDGTLMWWDGDRVAWSEFITPTHPRQQAQPEARARCRCSDDLGPCSRCAATATRAD
jgi:hypothetical protein